MFRRGKPGRNQSDYIRHRNERDPRENDARRRKNEYEPCKKFPSVRLVFPPQIKKNGDDCRGRGAKKKYRMEQIGNLKRGVVDIELSRCAEFRRKQTVPEYAQYAGQ